MFLTAFAMAVAFVQFAAAQTAGAAINAMRVKDNQRIEIETVLPYMVTPA